jgi:ATP-binding cassette subfamily B protein
MFSGEISSRSRVLVITSASPKEGKTTVLTMFGFWLPFALLASTLPALYVVLRYAARHHQWWLGATTDQRRAAYYEWVLTSHEHAAEVRLFGLGSWFRSLSHELRKRLAAERIALARDEGLAELGAGTAALAISGLALLWMGARAMRGLAGAGDLALFYQAFQQGLGLMRTLLASVGQIYRSGLFLEGLFEFLNLQPAIVKRPNAADAACTAACTGIRFRNVKFHYPGSSRLTLADFSLDVPSGSMVAIVGENGAGKSTLTKLLCRFYDPDEGSIELDGRDLRDFPPDELRRRISALFQAPAQYQATVAENIAPSIQVSGAEIQFAAHAAGADTVAARLRGRYDHPLGRWFHEGAELSVGEWQRIALARAFFRDGPILLLDEPTSAMDPWAEAEWLGRLRAAAGGRTTILITHRFTTARIADRIAVMAGGRIVEEGSHPELLHYGGRYAEAWQ